MKILLEIAVPGPFQGGLDYELPETMLGKNKILPDQLKSLEGRRVRTTLGKREVTGVILKIKTPREDKDKDKDKNKNEDPENFVLPTGTPPLCDPASPSGRSKIKPIQEILDATSIYQGALFELILWISQYYHHPIGDTFQTALIGALSDPLPLVLEPTESLVLTETGKLNYLRDSLSRPNSPNSPDSPDSHDSLNSPSPPTSAMKSLGSLESFDSPNSPVSKNKSAPSKKCSPQQEKLLALLNQAKNQTLSKEEIKTLEISPSAIQSLLQKNWIEKKLETPILIENIPTDFPKKLTPEQQEALHQSLEKNTFHVQCLEGVTGSGKTEVYLQRIAPVLAQGKQVLILVPEIGLTPQTLKRFESRFKYPVIALHSGLNATEKKAAIYHSLQGQAKIMIGTRSAIFIPTQNLGMIIVDEEHDLSFKQQNGLRYHARDVAIKRAQLENIPILLGSATPSLETLHHAMTEKYLHLKLLERPGSSTLPLLHCINLKAQKNLIDGLSQPLIQAIKKHLDTRGQILIFINRRGFAPMLMCHDCGWQAICPRCEKPYTLHIHPTRLCCHHCEVQKNILAHCPECDSESPLSDVGVGTEKIELALQTLFPDKKILRIDRSNTTRKNSMKNHLEQIQSGEADILVGTQMLAKGHHFEKLTMVGVVKIDDALFSNDFRSSEHLGQLLTQVCGRAGREKIQGEVYIQTHHIDHPLLNLLLKEGYSSYAKTLLEERKNTNFPPFSHLALIRAEGHSVDQNHDALREIKHLILRSSPSLNSNNSNNSNTLECLGPFPAFLAKRGGIYRSQLLIQSQNRKSLHHVLNQLQFFLKKNPIKKIRLFFDIDPIELD
jgi:primosomal protein N' (replication factor Y)